MYVVALLACGGRADLPAPAPTAPPTVGADADGGAASVEIVLDRGRFDAGGWVSEPVGIDTLEGARLEPGQGSLARARRVLPLGPGVARIHRGCGVVEVPYVVTTSRTVVLPYPACAEPDAPPIAGARLARREVAWSDVARLQALGLLPDVPPPPAGEEEAPARWITLAEARTYCAWWGARLPTRAEWRAARTGSDGAPIGPREAERTGGPLGPEERALSGLPTHRGPAGHEDLDGNVEEWLLDGGVAGGGWLGLPAWVGTVREVPASARSEGIGLRCAWDQVGQ